MTPRYIRVLWNPPLLSHLSTAPYATRISHPPVSQYHMSSIVMQRTRQWAQTHAATLPSNTASKSRRSALHSISPLGGVCHVYAQTPSYHYPESEGEASSPPSISYSPTDTDEAMSDLTELTEDEDNEAISELGPDYLDQPWSYAFKVTPHILLFL